MSNTEFETYLYISSEKFIILSKRNTDKDSFFKEKFIFDKLKKNLDLELLNQFLSENIFKIEKNINGFIKNINLIIEKNFLKIKISIKKDNYDKVIDKKILNYSLGDAKRQVKENYKNHEIIHLLVEKYFINDQTYDYFPLNKKADNLIIDLSFLCLSKKLIKDLEQILRNYQISINNYKNHEIIHLLVEKYFINDQTYDYFPLNKKADNLIIDLSFLCLSKKLIKDLEQILRNYQISINKIVSADYVENYFEYDNSDIFSNCQRIIEGINQNEVLLIAKNQKKLGFFERFFHLFS